MRWLIDGYNVIRRAPELASRERESLEAGRHALVRLLTVVAREAGDTFAVVFDGIEAGGSSRGGEGVAVVFSSARESADHVLARMARAGGAVVSNDREVRRAAERAGAPVITADQFLARLDEARRSVRGTTSSSGPEAKDENDEPLRGPRKGNPRRLSKKDRAANRALGRLGPNPPNRN